MDQPRLVQDRKRVEELVREDPDETGAETSKRVLFDEFVKVRGEEFESDAEMFVMDEVILHPEDVMDVVRIPRLIQLCDEQPQKSASEVDKMRSELCRTNSSIITSIIDCW